MSDQPTSNGQPGRALARDLSLYTLARLVLVAVLAAVIVGIGKATSHSVPLLVALMFAIVLSLPISMLLFKRLRSRVNASIAIVDERRRRDKADLRARLRGDAPAATVAPKGSPAAIVTPESGQAATTSEGGAVAGVEANQAS